MANDQVIPRDGPCNAWIDSTAVLSFPGVAELPEEVNNEETAAQMADVASDILYKLSGRQYTGECGPVTVRPIMRGTDGDTRGLVTTPGGYLASYGWPSAWGAASGGVASHYGITEAPTVELGAFPITQVTLVKIDGTVIPPNEYYLQSYRQLVRRRPTASATPTERWGWPTSQLVDLPDTEPGTFSVTYKYGSPPPQAGVWAAEKLAQMLMRDAGGEDDVFPTRVTSVSRQGVTVAVVDVMDFFSKGLTGIYALDLFVKAVNPKGSVAKPIAWSPDLGRPRRLPQGIT